MNDIDKVAKAIFHADDMADKPDDWAWGGTTAASYRRMAQAAIDALGPQPDRAFTDNLGQRWEWCGGQEGTWAWRRTADVVEFTEETRVVTNWQPVSNSPYSGHARPDGIGRRECRLVGPWVRVRGGGG